MSKFKSPDEIVAYLKTELTSADVAALREFSKDQLGMLHHSFGRGIRNEFLLWDDQNPHTLLNYKPDVRDGVDYSPKHPDAVSMKIIERLWEELKDVQPGIITGEPKVILRD